MSNAIWCEGKRGICHGEMYCTECEHADGKGSVELSESLLDYIRQLEEQVPRWISVTDDLPKSRYKKYEVWLANACVADVAEYYGDGEWMYPNCYNITRFVTHWKEMPEGPKEG